MNDSIKERLRELADNAHEISKADRDYLKALAHEYDVQFDDCRKCPNKWHDLALEIFNKLNKPEDTDNGSEYQLKAGVDVIFMGLRINAATMNDKLGAFICKRGFPAYYWRKIPNAD